jgi:cytidylate kinase
VPFDEVEKNVILRDKMDTERKINPLIRVPDAFYLLTDGFSVDEIINILIEEFNSIK